MKTFRLIGMIFLAMSLLVSCGGGDDPVAPDKPDVPEKPDKPDKPKDPSISVPSGEVDYFAKGMVFDANTGEKSFTFETDADWSLSVAATRSGEDWCSVSPSSGKAGKHTVAVKVEANSTYDDRKVTLTLAAGTTKKTILVTQKQQDALTLTTDKFEVDAKGGSIEVEVKANISYDVVIPETSKGWISKSTKSRGLTASTLVFDIAASEESAKREGEILIQSGSISETVHVYQAGQKILLLSKSRYDVAAAGETIQVELKSNCEYGVKMPQVDWIVEDKGSRAASSHTLSFIIQANESYDSRDAKIVFYDKESVVADTLHIVQAQKNALIVGQKDFNVSAEGENIQVKVGHNVEYSVDIKDTWITQAGTRGLTEDNLTFTVAPNEATEARTGKIVVTSKDQSLSETITVTQSATAAGSLTIAQKNYSVRSDGETIEVEIESNIRFSSTINSSWIQQVSSKNTSATTTVISFRVAANSSYDSRTATIEFYNREVGVSESITIFQAQKDALIISRKSFNVKAEGDVIQLKVNRNIDYTVRIEGSWIKQTATRGLVEDVLSFTVQANESTSQRSGKIIISSKDGSISETVVISQYGKSAGGDGDAGGTAPDFPWG